MRKEKDSMGDMQIPDDAYYGAQTQRAVENFPISGITISKSMIQALGKIKRSAAIVNHELGLLDDDRKNAMRENLTVNSLLTFIRLAQELPVT